MEKITTAKRASLNFEFLSGEEIDSFVHYVKVTKNGLIFVLDGNKALWLPFVEIDNSVLYPSLWPLLKVVGIGGSYDIYRVDDASDEGDCFLYNTAYKAFQRVPGHVD